MILKIIANLEGGDLVTPDNELTYKIYGSSDNYASPIATLGSAINDSKVSVANGIVTIENVDVGSEDIFKISSVDEAGNEAELSDAVSTFEGLLNEFPGASLGLSLRLLDRNYTGFCIKVRRSSNNDELDIGFVNNELDTASLLTFAGSGDAFVTIWYDSSGLNNNAFQTSAGNQPKIVDSGSVILDEGKPAILFSGLKWLQTVNPYPTNQYLSAFYLATSTGIDQRVLDTRGTGGFGNRQGWHAKYSDFKVDSFLIDDGSGDASAIEDISYAGRNLVSNLVNGGANGFIKSFKNSVNLENTSFVNSIDYDSGNVLTIGINSNGQNTQRFNGKMQEVILYSADKGSERVGIENNINDYYSIY